MKKVVIVKKCSKIENTEHSCSINIEQSDRDNTINWIFETNRSVDIIIGIQQFRNEHFVKKKKSTNKFNKVNLLFLVIALRLKLKLSKINKTQAIKSK